MKVLAPCHTQGPTVAHGLSWGVILRGGSPYTEQWGRQGSGEGLCTGRGTGAHTAALIVRAASAE